jgi:hypothetical protein
MLPISRLYPRSKSIGETSDDADPDDFDILAIDHAFDELLSPTNVDP